MTQRKPVRTVQIYQRHAPNTAITPIDAAGWRAVAIGLGLAVILLAISPLTVLLSPLITLVHELGHAALAWCFGYFALPAFDFMYGGGITLQSNTRITAIVLAIYAGFAFLFYQYRHNPLTCKILAGVLVIYCISAYTSIHHILMIAMGHGFELIFAGLFLYRALSGSGCRYSIDRTLYGILGCFIILYDVRFSYQLLTDLGTRSIYEAGKGGILDHDFVRLAHDYFHTNLSVIVAMFLMGCLATPIITVFIFRYRILMHDVVERLS